MIPTQARATQEHKKASAPTVKLLAAACGLVMILAGLLSIVHQTGLNSKPAAAVRVEASAEEEGGTPVTDRSLAKKLAKAGAPLIVLFLDDRNRPSSVEHFFAETRLMDGNGNVKKENPTAADVGSADAQCYLEMKNPPTKQNPIETGQTTSNGKSSAPLYARVWDDGTYYRVTYALFYPVSGFQIFRIAYTQNLQLKKRNFEWGEIAFHEGDWEHVQVWLKKTDPYKVVGMALGQHGKTRYYPKSEIQFFFELPSVPSVFGEKSKNELENSKHPVLYSAWNTHAMYPGQIQDVQEEIPATVISGFAAQSLKIIDTTEQDETTKEYARASDKSHGSPQLLGWKNLVVTNGIESQLEWLNFEGRWGTDVSNQMENPPSFGPDRVERWLRDMKNIVNSVGRQLDPKLFTANGPKAPQAQAWWREKIPSDAPSGQMP